MKKLFFLLSFICCMFCVISCSEKTPINEIPMYGNIPPTEALKKCNEEFIKEMTQRAGGREAGSQEAIKLAWDYYRKGDQRTAMKRFNQAWLLNPNNAEAFFGFAFLNSVQGKIDEAIPFYKKCLEISPNHQLALANLGRAYKEKAYLLYRKKRLDYPDEEVKKITSKGLIFFEKASQVAGDSSNLGYIYYEWALALEFNCEYAKAWGKIKLCRKYGGSNLIAAGFIKELSGFMPEPKEK